MGDQWKTFCICLSGTLILAVVALIACVVAIVCAPAHLHQCQEQLKNTTAALTGKLEGLQKEKEALEKQRDGARAEVTELRGELAGTNQTLWGRWDTCRNWTHVLENNIMALQDKIAQLGARRPEEPGEKGEINMLRQQLKEVQQQRDKLQSDVRRLEQQQLQSPKNQNSSGSGLWIPAIAPLALSLAGLLLL